MKLKWCVIGATGLIGKKAIPDGLMKAVNCELVAVQGLFEKDVKPLSEKWRVKGYINVDDLLNESDCDAVYIASPQNVHIEHVRKAASHRRHILCEKPLGRNSDEVREMISICAKAGIKLGTAFNNRFQSLNVLAKKLIDEGMIGKVISARCQFGQNYPPVPGVFRQIREQAGGGSMIDLGNHAIDLMEYITGKKFKSIIATSQNVIHKYEVEDCCAALLEFEEGGFGMVDTYYNSPIATLRNDLEINGTKGTIYTIGTLSMNSAGKLVVRTEENTLQYNFSGRDMYCEEFEAFANALLHGSEPPCNHEDGLHSQLIIDACYESAKKGCKVEIS